MALGKPCGEYLRMGGLTGLLRSSSRCPDTARGTSIKQVGDSREAADVCAEGS